MSIETKIKLSDLNPDEKTQLINEVDGDNAGCGILHTGKYYVLAYKNVKNSNTYKCTGVELFIHKIQESGEKRYIPSETVLFKQSIFSLKESFKDRLDYSIKRQTNLVFGLDKEIDDEIARVAKMKMDRERAIRKHTDDIRSCELKIDSTIKSLAPKAKSLIEYKNEKLLEERAKEEASRISESKAQIIREEPDIPVSPTRKFSKFSRDQMESVVEKTWLSEKEKQFAVNEAILYPDNRVRPKPVWSKTTDTRRDFIKEYVFEPGYETPLKANTNVIEAELVLPSNPKYMTSLEKQNSMRNKEPQLVTDKIVG